MITALAAAKAYAAQGSMATPSLGGTGEAKKAMDFGALLKSAMTDTLHQVGALDVADAAELEATLGQLDALAAESLALRAAPQARRDTLALRLYRHLALFVAENFQHMHVEETANNAALWAHYGDAELQALHGRLLASLSQAETAQALRWMLPALNPAERAGLMQGLRATLPAPAFRGLLDTLGPQLPDPAWRKLRHSLDLDASRP